MTKHDPENRHPHNVIFSDDADGLAAIGKTQAFDRRYNLWSVVGIGICVSSAWSGVSSAILPTLVSGGAVTVVWGFVLTAIGVVLVAASLAELASVWPSSGGQYHWAAELSSPYWRPFLSWVTGWLAFGSMILGAVGSTVASSVQIQTFARACNPSYEAKPFHVTMIFFAEMLINAAVNIFGVRYYHGLNLYFIFHQTVFFVAIIITLLACTAPHFNSAKYVFTNFQNNSGWSSDGVSFFIGVLGLATGFVGVEAPAHFSEEMNHATRDVPRAIMYGTIGNALATFPYLIVLLFSMGSIQDLVASKFGSVMPIFQIILDSTKSIPGTVILNFGLAVIAFLSALDINGACARTIWSMARDEAFPAPFRRVHPKWDVPVWPVITICLVECGFACIYIGNTTAFYGIMSGIQVLQTASYAIPIALHIFQRGKILYGPWRMPHYIGYPVNIGALCWCILGFVFFTFPIYMPVTATNMNYSSTILGGVSIISMIIYFTYARGRFVGPIRDIDGVEEVGTESEQSHGKEESM